MTRAEAVSPAPGPAPFAVGEGRSRTDTIGSARFLFAERLAVKAGSGPSRAHASIDSLYSRRCTRVADPRIGREPRAGDRQTVAPAERRATRIGSATNEICGVQ